MAQIVLCLSVSCSRRTEYVYDDVVVTRYDYSRFSKYYCNKSDKNSCIKISGNQNFYIAYLLIDKHTKKTWIVPVDCSIEQSVVDKRFFQADIGHERLNPQSFRSIAPEIERDYACYALCMYGEDSETKYTKEYFPNSEIKAKYCKVPILLGIYISLTSNKQS